MKVRAYVRLGPSMAKAIGFLDFRKKKRIFKIFLVLFFVMGLSFGFRGGFVFPFFLSENGFDAETIGMLLGFQILLAGLFSHVFSRKMRIEKLILVSGLLYTLVFLLLGFANSIFAALLIVGYGMVEGLLSIGQEGIVSKITGKESYGTDIGLLMMGLHSGITLSLGVSGFLIEMWGFMALFSLSALTFATFYIISYFILKNDAHLFSK